MKKAQPHISMARWLIVLGVGLIATPSAAQLGTYGNQLWYQDSPGIHDLSEADDMFGNAVATGDFDNDGYDDVAIGIANEEFVGGANVGAVGVLYGGPSGPSALFDDLWHQDSPGILGESEEGDGFGGSLAAGDFDDDGYDDLAIGIPAEDIGGTVDAGAVQILYGSAVGLSASDNQLWFQDSSGIPGDSEENDFFGSSLAVGDFDDDGYDDLAIGSPLEDLGGINGVGSVHILYGTFQGLTASFSQVWSQNSPGILGVNENGDTFGSSLAAGDFNANGFDDLAIGVPFKDLGEITWAGVVHIIYGTSAGLTAADNQVWHQDSPGILDTAEEQDFFGKILATGDFDNDFFEDLAIGNPEEGLGATWSGTVQLFYGSAGGLSAAGNQLWSQDSPGIIGVVEGFDRFGSSLAVGDFSKNGFDDLAIGVPDEDVRVLNDGAVQILYGTAAGLSATDNQLWYQDSPGMLGAAEEFDSFGASLAAGDFDNNGFADLAVGIPEENIGALEDAGAVQIVFGGPLIFSDGFESGDTSAWSSTVP